ncbi:hypothetical protein TNCV_1859521 [Trichonephila clavipes]|nr:hypothetical protein TNCV_1859521 [Trichonephila clavipes]
MLAPFVQLSRPPPLWVSARQFEKRCVKRKRKLVLRPILQYASPIWGHAAYSNIKMLESAQNKIIKIITDSPCFTTLKIRRVVRAVFSSDDSQSPSVGPVLNFDMGRSSSGVVDFDLGLRLRGRHQKLLCFFIVLRKLK